MEHVSNHLSAYLDGELTPELRAQVESHLSQCSDCSKELAALQQTSAILQQLPLPTPSPIFLDRLHASIESAARRPMERFIGMLSGVAACVAIVGGLLLMQPGATALATSSTPAAWESDAGGGGQLADDSLDNTPETAIGQWMVAGLSAYEGGQN